MVDHLAITLEGDLVNWASWTQKLYTMKPWSESRINCVLKILKLCLKVSQEVHHLHLQNTNNPYKFVKQDTEVSCHNINHTEESGYLVYTGNQAHWLYYIHVFKQNTPTICRATLPECSAKTWHGNICWKCSKTLANYPA